MKKISIFMLALGFMFVGHSAFADEATSTPNIQPGGYSNICTYVSVYQKVCKDSDYSTYRFAFDDNYRETILAPWRFVIFHGKYNHQD